MKQETIQMIVTISGVLTSKFLDKKQININEIQDMNTGASFGARIWGKGWWELISLFAYYHFHRQHMCKVEKPNKPTGLSIRLYFIDYMYIYKIHLKSYNNIYLL